VLLLVVSLLSLAALFVIMQAQFVGVVQILVYAGGVVILMAFGIMLTNRPEEGKLLTTHKWLFPGVFVCGLLGYIMLKVQSSFQLGSSIENMTRGDQVVQIGEEFMTTYLIAFELIAFVLLVVLVGASFLAKRFHQS
jgi:NADH-quinone oxidoreductase subunit J